MDIRPLTGKIKQRFINVKYSENEVHTPSMKKGKFYHHSLGNANKRTEIITLVFLNSHF